MSVVPITSRRKAHPMIPFPASFTAPSSKIAWLVAGIGLLLAGCQGEPAVAPGTAHLPTQVPSVAEDPGSRFAPILAATVRFDPANGVAELFPARLIQAGTPDVLEHVDVTQFFTSAPCTDCLRIAGIGQAPSGNPTLDISIRHPFPSPGPGVQMRQDLAVFNVEGLVLFADAGASVQSFSNGRSALTSTRLVNADGYSGALDAAYDLDYFTTQATLHPYRLFFDDYSAGTYDAGNEQGFTDYADIRGFLAMGQGQGPSVKTYEFALPQPGAVIEFELVVQAAFGHASANIGERMAPEYRLPQYNKKAASEVHVGVSQAAPGNASGRGLLGGVSSSAAEVRIEVLDITDSSTGVAVGPGRGQIRSLSDVSALSVEIPGVLNSAITISDPATVRIGGTGNDPESPLTYAIGITNEAAALSGTYFGLVKVTDSYPLDINTLLPEDAQRYLSPGLTTPFPLTEIATYAVFPVTVNPNSIDRLTSPSLGDAFGTSLATGDFNGDGVLDLAVGAFERDIAASTKAGAVYVYYQFPNGEFAPPILLTETVPGTNVRFGFALAAGDVTGDGRDDLIASAVNANIPGRVQLFRSQGLGFLSPVPVQDLTLSNGARFGWALDLADANGDGRADALISAPETLGSFTREGRVYRYIGTTSGFGNSPQLLSAPDSQVDALFGSSLSWLRDQGGTVAGAVVGMPGHASNTGRVYAYTVDSNGALLSPSPIDPNSPQPNSNFGYALVLGDLNQDGRPDLVVGAPGSPSLTIGQVEIFHLSGSGVFEAVRTLTISGADTFSFGSAVALGDFTGDGRNDVASGGLLLEAASNAQAGRVALFPSGQVAGPLGLEWHAPTPSVDQLFSRSMLSLEVPGGRDLLLIGAPGDDPAGLINAGSVYVY